MEDGSVNVLFDEIVDKMKTSKNEDGKIERNSLIYSRWGETSNVSCSIAIVGNGADKSIK
jgi:hypothetical protein